MSGLLSTCVLCPRLCRPACPVATGTAREAATPTAIASALFLWERGQWTVDLAAAAVTLCVDCGACEDFCHIGQPLPELLRNARAELLSPPVLEALRDVEGEGSWLVIEADERPLAAALSRYLGEPVRRWTTGDRLGVAGREHSVWETQAARLRARIAGARVVVADGGVAEALEASNITFQWLHEVVPEVDAGLGSCRVAGESGPLACCGAAGPLVHHHPDDARRVADAWLVRAPGRTLRDARCREHLRAAGGQGVTDAVDALLELGA